MAQADRKRFIFKIALFLGGLLVFGFVLKDLNRRSSPERERWSLAPGPGVTIRLDRPADIFRKLELTDGSLELPARWLEIIPGPGYLIANSILKSLASELLLDTRYPVELGYRTTGDNQPIRFIVVTTKNSAIASDNLAKILKVEPSEGQAATISRGALSGQALVWKSARRQLAVVVGTAADEANRVLDQIKATKTANSKGIRFTYQGSAKDDPIDALTLELTFEDFALNLKGRASTQLMLPTASINQNMVLLAVRSTPRMQPLWVLAQPDGSWCQRGLTPFWQKALGATQRCVDDPPLGAYVHISRQIFERFDVPWTRAEVTIEQRDQTLAITGRATSTETLRFFPLYKAIRSVSRNKRVKHRAE